MYAPEVRAPIDVIPEIPPLDSRNVRSLTNRLELTVAEAAIALDLFLQARLQQDALAPDDWFDDDPDRTALVAQVVLPQDRPEYYFEVAPSLHARTFVLSLRMIGVLIETLAIEAEGWRPELRRISDAFNASFPGLRELRNSIAHMEDRLRHLDQKKRSIVLQPIPDVAPQGHAFLADFLKGDTLMWTLADGSAGACEVSERNLRTAVHHATELVSAVVEKPLHVHPASA